MIEIKSTKRLIQSERNLIDQLDSIFRQRQAYTLHHVIARICST